MDDLNLYLIDEKNEIKKNKKIGHFRLIFLFFMMVYSRILFAIELDYWATEISLSSMKQSISKDDLFNPSNQFLALPEFSDTLNIRPELRLSWLINSSFTFRPIFEARHIPHKTINKFRWNEIFINEILTEKIQVTYGLQSYQWGPAESASPSNFIFKDTIVGKDALYLPRGLHLLRFNFSPTQAWSEIFLAELSGNGDMDYYKNKDAFEKKALLKSEWTWGESSDYFGVVLGWQDFLGFNLGEYLSLEISEALYFYVDAHHKKGSARWRPFRNSENIISFVQDEKNNNRNYSYAVSGLRYNFVNGGDLRFEYIYEEDSYSKTEHLIIKDCFSSSQFAQQLFLKDNILHFYNSNLHYVGQQFVMLSYNKSNFLSKNNFLLAMRFLYSLSDQSVRGYFNLEKSVGKQGTVFAFLIQNIGKRDSELNTLISSSYNMGYRHSF